MAVASFRSSELFKALPFHTSNFLDNDDAINAFKEAESRLAGLCDAVIHFDNSVKALSLGDSNYMKLLFFKKWFLPNSTLGETAPSKQNTAYAIEAILAHRLLETAQIIYHPSTSDAELLKSTTDPVKLMIDQQTGHVPKIQDAIQAFRSGPTKHMESETDTDVALNVFEVCEEARKLLTSHWDSKGRSEVPTEREHVKLDWKDQEVDIRLWKGIADNTVEVEARSILLNIEIAAAHMRLLITKRSLHTPPLLELQEKYPDSKELLTKNRFHRCLWIALSISPVFLLRKFDISNMFQLNTHNIFDFWSRSAMSRGDAAFLQLENKIWRTLFEISLGQPTQSALECLFADLEKSSTQTRLVIPLPSAEPLASSANNMTDESNHYADRHLLKHQKLHKRKAKDQAEKIPRKKLKEGIQEVVVETLDRKASSESPDVVSVIRDYEALEPDHTMTNFESKEVVAESNATTYIDNLQGVSILQSGVCDSISIEDVTISGRCGEESGSCLNSDPTNLDLSGGAVITGPEQQPNRPPTFSEVDVKLIEAPMVQDHLNSTDAVAPPPQIASQGKEHSQGSERNSVSKTLRLLAVSESGIKRVSASLQNHKVMEGAVINKAEQHLVNSLQMPILISYIPRKKEEEGWPQLNLERNCRSPLYQGGALLDYLPNAINYTPMAHSLLGLDRIEKLFKRTKLYYEPGVSCLLKLSSADWSCRNAKLQQDGYSKTELIIVPEHYHQPEFGRDLLLNIAGSSLQPIQVYDHSAICTGFNGQQKIGNIDLILAHSKEESGSILHSLNIPSIGDGASNVSPEESIATDLSAFRATGRLPYCGFGHPYPSTSMRWSSCGLQHAATPFSQASEGLGTYFQVISGMLVLFVANPVLDGYFAENSCFVSPGFDRGIPDTTLWKINAQIVEAGSIWPYALLNLEHTVCRGGFLYTWATIQDTCYGVYHSFFSDQDSINPELGWESRMLLRRIVTYYHLNYVGNVPQTDFRHHLPVLTAFSDVVSLLCLLNVVILGQILYRPYHDNPDVMVDQHKKSIFAQGRREAQELLTYLSRNFHFILENRAVNFWQLFTAYLVLQVRCMVQHAMISAQAGGHQRACTPNSLLKALSVYFCNKPWFLDELVLQQKRNITATTYAWKFEEQYSLIRRTDPTVEAEVDLAFPADVNEDKVVRLFTSLNKEL